MGITLLQIELTSQHKRAVRFCVLSSKRFTHHNSNQLSYPNLTYYLSRKFLQRP